MSGNLSFLNWLTITIALVLFRRRRVPRAHSQARSGSSFLARRPLGRERRIVTGAARRVIAMLSLNPIVNLLSARQAMNAAFDPFDLVNTYGAFGSINRVRNEIILEGTADALGPSTRWVALRAAVQAGRSGAPPVPRVTLPVQARLADVVCCVRRRRRPALADSPGRQIAPRRPRRRLALCRATVS